MGLPFGITTKKAVVVFFSILLFLVVSGGSYFYFTFSRTVVDSSETDQMLLPVPELSMFDLSPIPTPTEPTTYNILLLGYGGEGHPGGNLSDSLMVVHIDPTRKQITFVSVPRDLWITLPEGDSRNNRKINHAYVFGGGALAKQAVSTVLGLPIQYFISVSFDGLKEAIDILDGVEVDVPVTFDDYYFPVVGKENEPCGKSPEEVEEILTTLTGFEIDKQFPCRFEQIHFDAGKQLMDGETALIFTRSRHSVQHGGDFARSERQYALLVGIKDRLFSLGALDDAIPFFNQLSHTIQTDIDEDAIGVLLGVVGDGLDYRYSAVGLTEQNVLTLSTSNDGQSILLPKAGAGEWKGIHAFVEEALSP